MSVDQRHHAAESGGESMGRAAGDPLRQRLGKRLAGDAAVWPAAIPFQPVLRIPWPFDQDLDASAGVLEQEEGVYYAVIPTTNEDFASWNKLVVTWSIRVFSSNTPVNFQSILFGDGTVLL